MSDLQALYQSVILDHNRSPRNRRVMEDASHRAAGRNPMCGDEITVWLRVEGDRIADVSFEGKGCAISQASASMMTQALKGQTREEATRLFERFHAMVMGQLDAESAKGDLGRAVALAGVSRFPMRVKCASLGWHAFRAALESGATATGDAPAVIVE